MTAPTEEEIRATLARTWTRDHPTGRSPLFQWDLGFNDGFLGMATAPWDVEDLRDSELERLDELAIEALRPIREAAERAAIESLVGAMLQFAAEHPDAPRARPQPVEA